MTTAKQVFEDIRRQSLLGEVTGAFDAVEAALLEARSYERVRDDENIESRLTTARDLLFAVRLTLDSSS